MWCRKNTLNDEKCKHTRWAFILNQNHSDIELLNYVPEGVLWLLHKTMIHISLKMLLLNKRKEEIYGEEEKNIDNKRIRRRWRETRQENVSM